MKQRSLKWTRASAVLLYGLLTCIAPSRPVSAASPSDFTSATASIESELPVVENSSTLTDSDKSALTSIRDSVHFLNDHWSPTTQVSHLYVASLKYDDTVLTKIPSLTLTDRSRALSFVSADLRAKKNNCQLNLDKGGAGFGQDIEITANTKHVTDDSAATGYTMFWSWGFVPEIGDPHEFDTMSSPAKCHLPPGVFLFWAEKGSVKTDSDERSVSDSTTIDVKVP